MKYMGSKAKIAEFIVPIIQSHIAVSGSRTYIEPFCGGCNVIDKVQAKNRIAADKNEYLIELFKHLQVGGGLPFEITKEEYDRVKENTDNFPPWYVGIAGIDFMAKDYREFKPCGCVIYCDPPYEETKDYISAKDFNRPKFWQTMREWSRDNVVLISELQAPEDFITVWEREVDRSMKAKEHFRATEKLFVYRGGGRTE